MTRRLAPALAWLILAACAVNVIVSGWFFYQAPPANVSPSLSLFITLWLLIPFLAFPLVGAFIVAQRPSNTVGWILLAAGVGTLMSSFSAAYIGLAKVHGTINDLPVRWVDLAGNIVWPVNITLGVFLLFLFPDGRPLSPRWRIVVWTLLAVIGAIVLAQAVAPGPLEPNGQARNPIGVLALAGFSGFVLNVGQSSLAFFLLLAIVGLALRYRRAGLGQRQQIKWFVFGSVVMIVVVMAGIFADPLDPNSVAGQIIANITFGVGILALPLGVGVGALRYRLYDIDVLINRALVYGSLTALLGALYFGLVAGAQALIRLASHQTGENQLVIVLTTLLVAALVQPLRRGLQSQIDHRFYRRKYDAARTLEAFGATLRSEVELTALKNHLLDVVSETMQPAAVSLWLRPGAALAEAVATSLPVAKEGE